MARLTEFEEDNWLLSEANKRLEKMERRILFHSMIL